MSARRAIARVNLAAIERNCRRLREELEPGCELCVVVKADGYGHGAAQSARAALDAGATWLAVAGAHEAVAAAAGGLRRGATARDGRSQPGRAGRSARGRGRRRRVERADGWRRRASRWRSCARQARQRHGPARHTRPRARAARGSTCRRDRAGRAGRGDDPLRDRRRRARSVLRAPARDVQRLGRAAQGRISGHRRARRQQCRHSARAALPLRHGSLWHRRIWDGPLRARPARTPARPCARAGLLSGRGQGLRSRPERRLRTALRRRAGHAARGAPDRLRRRLATSAVEQRRRVDRRAAATDRGHGQHGQPDGRSRRGRAGSRLARQRGRADRRARRAADNRRGGGAADGHDQLRGDVRADRAGAARLPPRRSATGRAGSRAGGDSSAGKAARRRASAGPAAPSLGAS